MTLLSQSSRGTQPVGCPRTLSPTHSTGVSYCSPTPLCPWLLDSVSVVPPAFCLAATPHPYPIPCSFPLESQLLERQRDIPESRDEGSMTLLCPPVKMESFCSNPYSGPTREWPPSTYKVRARETEAQRGQGIGPSARWDREQLSWLQPGLPRCCLLRCLPGLPLLGKLGTERVCVLPIAEEGQSGPKARQAGASGGQEFPSYTKEGATRNLTSGLLCPGQLWL